MLRKQPELKVVMVPIDELKPYENNAKKHTNEQMDAVEASIREFDFTNPVIAWHDEDGRPVIVAGHARAEAARRQGLEAVPVIFRDDWDDAKRRAYVLVDNQTTMMTGWDDDLLKYELDTLADTFDMEDFGFDLGGETLGEEFSTAIGTVDYEPSGKEHAPAELFSMTDRFDEMIEAMDAPEEVKELCRIRAKWFCEFDYAKIADYYCSQASPEVQRVFEALALVLLDRDQLIENGFADLLEVAGVMGGE